MTVYLGVLFAIMNNKYIVHFSIDFSKMFFIQNKPLIVNYNLF